MEAKPKYARELIEKRIRELVIAYPETYKTLREDPKEFIASFMRSVFGDTIDEAWLEELEVELHVESGRTMHIVVPDLETIEEPFTHKELLEVAGADIVGRAVAARDPGLNSFLRTFEPNEEEIAILNDDIGQYFGSNGGCPICGFTTGR